MLKRPRKSSRPIKAMKYNLVLSFLLALAACGGTTSYSLDPSRSKIEFISIKDGGIAVVGLIKNPSGHISTKKDESQTDWASGEVAVDIANLDTQNEPRNANIRNIFFETGRGSPFSQAHFLLEKYPLKEEASSPVLLEGSLKLHGITAPLSLPVKILKKEGEIRVVSTAPAAIDFSKWNFLDRIEPLMKACGHKALEPRATLNIDLLFTSVH